MSKPTTKPAAKSEPASMKVGNLTAVAVVHRAEEGGYWAEVPALPGVFTQAETLAGLRRNLREAIALYREAPAAPKPGATRKPPR